MAADNKTASEQISVKKGSWKDLAELQKRFAETIETTCAADYEEQEIKAWVSSVDDKQRWEHIMTKQFVLVAQYEDKIIGFATLENGNYIDLLYVHKDHQRQGIANKLLIDLEVGARRLKQAVLISDVSKTAKYFFEKNNFKILRKQIVNKQGISLINYKMAKKLTSQCVKLTFITSIKRRNKLKGSTLTVRSELCRDEM